MIVKPVLKYANGPQTHFDSARLRAGGRHRGHQARDEVVPGAVLPRRTGRRTDSHACDRRHVARRVARRVARYVVLA